MAANTLDAATRTGSAGSRGRGGGLAGRPAAAALVVALGSAATIAAAWGFERAGYTPCELCLLERDPFYVGAALALLTAGVARAGRRGLARVLCSLLALVFLASAGLAAYHAGVEWGIWAGPTGCSGAVTAAPTVGDFLKQLDSVKVVRCDAAALRILGLSLAGWNVLVSLALAGVAGLGVSESRASQG